MLISGTQVPRPVTLAVADYDAAPPPIGLLDLRWSPDEVEFVRAAIDDAWRAVTEGGVPAIAERARRYEVTDPYGARAGSAVVSAHHGHAVTADMLTFGSGVTGLLHDLAGLANGATVCAAPLSHPDLPTWSARLGAQLVPIDAHEDVEAAAATIRRSRARLVLQDNPDLLGRRCSARTIAELATAAEAVGALLVVDESEANYLGPHLSLSRLVDEHEHLVVLRGMSKGYCSGGLRVGYAVASPRATRLLRSVATPLAVSPLAFDVALQLLGQGDVLGSLRQRIEEVKPGTVRRFAAIDVEVRPGHPQLPSMTVAWSPEVARTLQERGIAGKAMSFAMNGTVYHSLVKLAVPLTAGRQHDLALATAPQRDR